MIRARFVYEGCLFGEWTETLPGGPMMVPNPKYAHRLLGVEFETSQAEAPVKPKRGSGRAYRLATIQNGAIA